MAHVTTEAERILDRLQTAQTKFWELLSELEGELGIDLDGTKDFSDYTVDELRAEAEGEDQ